MGSTVSLVPLLDRNQMTVLGGHGFKCNADNIERMNECFSAGIPDARFRGRIERAILFMVETNGSMIEDFETSWDPKEKTGLLHFFKLVNERTDNDESTIVCFRGTMKFKCDSRSPPLTLLA